MLQLPAVVAPLFQSDTLKLSAPLGVLALIGVLLGWPVLAQDGQSRYLAELEVHTAEEFKSILLRADQLLSQGALHPGAPAPVAFVLHGPEVRILLRQNYLQNKSTVDLAASLSALGVVEIKACETWMGGDGIAAAELQPFVSTVRYGPAEVRRLIEEENYLEF